MVYLCCVGKGWRPEVRQDIKDIVSQNTKTASHISPPIVGPRGRDAACESIPAKPERVQQSNHYHNY